MDPLTEPKLAFTVVVPVARLEESPCALMVAATGLDEVQTTDALMS